MERERRIGAGAGALSNWNLELIEETAKCKGAGNSVKPRSKEQRCPANVLAHAEEYQIHLFRRGLYTKLGVW